MYLAILQRLFILRTGAVGRILRTDMPGFGIAPVPSRGAMSLVLVLVRSSMRHDDEAKADAGRRRPMESPPHSILPSELIRYTVKHTSNRCYLASYGVVYALF